MLKLVNPNAATSENVKIWRKSHLSPIHGALHKARVKNNLRIGLKANFAPAPHLCEDFIELSEKCTNSTRSGNTMSQAGATSGIIEGFSVITFANYIYLMISFPQTNP